MEEIKTGEYIRLARNQGINKIIDIEENRYILDEDIADEYGDLTCVLERHQLKDEIVKHSKNIIDLIEVGDIVNGYKVLEISDSMYENSKRILIYKNEKEKYERWIYIQEYDGKVHTQEDIRSILTKEQYERNCYKVEE